MGRNEAAFFFQHRFKIFEIIDGGGVVGSVVEGTLEKILECVCGGNKMFRCKIASWVRIKLMEVRGQRESSNKKIITGES